MTIKNIVLDGTKYIDLTQELSFGVSTTLTVQNQTSGTLFITGGTTLPTKDDNSFQVKAGEFFELQASDGPKVFAKAKGRLVLKY